jgi:MinD-like ATPase involved in chromosome partitioning or flagellar assembly
MTQRKHLDEAREEALGLVRKVVGGECVARYAALIIDIYGRISLAVWGENEDAFVEIGAQFAAKCGEHWTGSLRISRAPNPADDEDVLMRTAWLEGSPLEEERARVTDRFRHHTAWRTSAKEVRSLWSLHEGPPIIAFHGFKGGVGRTTLLASYALACSQRGETVAVVDVDLDAPGVGTMLAADEVGTIARWGTVDYLLESAAPHPIEDYFHVLASDSLTGNGRLEVVPAGQLNDGYLPKLARVDLEPHGEIAQHPLAKLLHTLRERNPARILLDGRAGLSPAAGLILSGFAHLHVLIATSNAQSLVGLERVVRHLGYEAARQGRSQLNCVVVQALVPDSAEAARLSREAFAAHVERIFRDGYYATKSNEDDSIWSLDDIDSDSAPHVPIPIPYRTALAHYVSLDEIAEILTKDSQIMNLHERIDVQVNRQVTEGDNG